MLTQPRPSSRARKLITLIGRPQHPLFRLWLQLSCSHPLWQSSPLTLLAPLRRSSKARSHPHSICTLLYLPQQLCPPPSKPCTGRTGSALIAMWTPRNQAGAGTSMLGFASFHCFSDVCKQCQRWSYLNSSSCAIRRRGS